LCDSGVTSYFEVAEEGYYVVTSYFEVAEEGYYIVCDDMAKITLVEMRWPGSVHDNRVWLNSDVYLAKENYFSNKEYLLGDSAFSASMVMVPAFKKSPNATLSKERKYFNTKLAKVRIKSEIALGLSRLDFKMFQSLGGL